MTTSAAANPAPSPITTGPLRSDSSLPIDSVVGLESSAYVGLATAFALLLVAWVTLGPSSLPGSLAIGTVCTAIGLATSVAWEIATEVPADEERVVAEEDVRMTLTVQENSLLRSLLFKERFATVVGGQLATPPRRASYEYFYGPTEGYPEPGSRPHYYSPPESTQP